MMSRLPVLALVVLLLVPFSLFVIAYPFVQRPDEGALTVRWASPKGIVLRNMVKGDRVDVSYDSPLPLSIYLLELEAAEELRSSTFYKSELPEPAHTGSSGRVALMVESSGDKEVLFWNQSFTSDQTLDYTITVHRRLVSLGMVVSGSGLLVLCFGGAVFILRGRRPGTRDQFNHKDR